MNGLRRYFAPTRSGRDRATANAGARESGATMLEFAIVLPILLLLVIGIMDMARFLTIQALLNKGAEDGLNLAMKMPNLDIDYRGKTAADNNYQVYREARRRVLWAATRLPLMTLVTDFNQPSSAQLTQWTITDRGMSGTPASYTRGAVLLRPGEKADVDVHGSTITVEHPTVKPSTDGSPPPQAPEILMKKNPITVQLDARVDMFLPMFGSFVARGTATGFRENVPVGPLPLADPADAEAVDGLAFQATTTTVMTTITTVATTTYASCTPEWVECMNQTLRNRCVNGSCCPTDLVNPGYPPYCQCSPCSSNNGR